MVASASLPKKLSKKERIKLQAAQTEELYQAAVAERHRVGKEEKERVVQEAIERQAQAIQDQEEQIVREAQLELSYRVLNDCEMKMYRNELERRADEKWHQYLKCDYLPDPASLPEVNRYLFEWRLDESTCEIENVLQRTDEVIQMLAVISKLIDYPLDNKPSRVQEWMEIRNDVRREQQIHVDKATYNLLRRMETRLLLSALNVVTYSGLCPHFSFYLWSLLPLPPPGVPRAQDNMGHASETNFKDLGVHIEMPIPLADMYLAIRAVWFKYDHLTDFCRSTKVPPLPLNQSVETTDLELKEIYTYRPVEHELNLRKYTLLAGVLYLDLLTQPSQPKQLEVKYTVTTVRLPRDLQPVDFLAHYVPPPPPEPGKRRLPEEIEAELKQQEAELEKLCLVTITIPDTFLWFEPPNIVGWDPENSYWSTEDNHDAKFNEEKQTITFRTGRLGAFGFYVYRYCNFPYQTWELRPDSKSGGVLLNITAAISVIEFTFLDDLVCVSTLQHGLAKSSVFEEHINKYYRPRDLIQILQSVGLDIFPPHDAYCYVEGVCNKHRVCEDHLYHCMAVLSQAYQFTWSRWNVMGGLRKLIFQMREHIDKKKLVPYSVIQVTPLRATIVTSTELSQVYSEEVVPEMKFYADLYSMCHGMGSVLVKKKIAEMPWKLIETVHEMLRMIRPFSYS